MLTTFKLSNSGFYGLYIHIPFCLSKCFYCKFYSISDLSRVDVYFSALASELKKYRDLRCCVDTIYFGGGTPSAINSSYIIGVLKVIRRYFCVTPNPEITIEVNPGTVCVDKLRDYWLAGINRLSIGIQSLNDSILAFLGRSHTAYDSLDIFDMSRKIGFDNVGVDLIYGIPGLGLSEWCKELSEIVSMKPEHLSCYLLSFESGTPIGDEFINCGLDFANDILVSDMFLLTYEFLKGHAYYRYEISNFSKDLCGDPDLYVSKHNKKYWNFDNYLGFGTSAHSFLDNKRWWNHSCIDSYIDDILNGSVLPIAGEENLTFEQQIIEFIYLGLRQNVGVKISLFEERFGVRFFDLYAKPIEILLREELIEIKQDQMILTKNGFLFLDSIVLRFCL